MLVSTKQNKNSPLVYNLLKLLIIIVADTVRFLIGSEPCLSAQTRPDPDPAY
jgi:hypothetical protein